MDLHIENRRALVTGSTAGIGFAIAHSLAAEGAHVTLTGRTQPAIDAALARLRSSVPGARADGIAADCATAKGAETVFSRVPDVDILVNNLGIYERKPFFEIPDDDWMRLFEVNVLSGVRFARRYAPAMAKRGWGRVLFISSESALNVPREMIHYGTTGVTVNAVLPGPTRTENTERLRAERAKAAGVTVPELERDFFINFRPTSLIKRFTSAEEVANLAVYLCSEGASGTSGAALRVDGGVVNQIM
jgi:NAD(P)-dependent dehydrogenase (short-subunit alcohol dehydrogenase family)